MQVSPSASKLYRMGRRAVISLALALTLSQVTPAQFAKKSTPSKGPRAIGLLELAPSGKAHLIPVAILIDGDFQDASVYKADPVPMALESGTVYEAIKTGVSQGLFTVAGALQANNSWIGDGTWAVAGSTPAKKVTAPTRPPDEDVDAPPVLRHSKPAPKQPEAPPTESKPPAEPEKKAEAPAPAPVEAAPPVDADRPLLHRGKPEEAAEKPAQPEPVAIKPPSPVAPKPLAAAGVKIIPAISDARVQEPRSFEFKMNSEEEEQFRTKMLDMAASEISARFKKTDSSAAQEPTKSRPVHGKTAAKTPPPTFDDVQMTVFDLTSSNEPILVLTATAHANAAQAQSNLPLFVTLIARNNIYGELKKVSSTITDSQHLDVLPQMQLIDAVDADGDGRGELLFRRASDTSSAYAIYRVIGTQLYPLFEGKL